MQVYYMNLWSSHYDKAYKLVKTRMLNLGFVSKIFWGVSSRSRLEQKIERLGLVSQSFGERLVSKAKWNVSVSVSDKKVSFTSLLLAYN